MAAYQTLNADINASVTSIVLAGTPSPNVDPMHELVLIDSEVIAVASRSGATLTVTGGRGAYSSTPAAHVATTAVYDVYKVDNDATGLTVYYKNSSGAQVTKHIGVSASSPGSEPILSQVSPVGTITSGALPTTTFVSGTGKQIDLDTDVELYVPVTFDASAADATLAVALSPDGSTYSALGTETVKFATNPENGGIRIVKVRVPAGWYVKFTGTHATIGTGTYC